MRQSGINKGTFIKKVMDAKVYAHIFATGDDRTDKDMFKALQTKENTYTVKAGREASYAQYNLHSPQMVTVLLEGLTLLPKPVITP